LRARDLVPLAVTPVTTATTDGSAARFKGRVFSASGRAVWTRQLAGLVGSGLPLERALTALADEAETDRQRELVAHLKSEVNAGSSFARALSTAPREFDDIYRAVVAAGEQSGALGPVLERLADDLEQQQALRAKVLGAMLYPAIVSLVAVIIVTVLVTWVVPQIANVFTSSKRALPFLTVAMLGISSFVRQWGWAVVLLAAGSTALGLARRNEAFRERTDAALLRLPLLGRLIRGYNAARFGGTLAMLAGAGVPILKACRPRPRPWATAPCGTTRWMPWCRCVKARRWPVRWPARSAFRACWRCLRAWVSRPASCRACWTARRPSCRPRFSAAPWVRPPSWSPAHRGHGPGGGVIMLAVLLPIIQLNTWVK
jgi:general secretion pathway protein F